MRSPMKNSVFRRCGSSRSARAILRDGLRPARAAVAIPNVLALRPNLSAEDRRVDGPFQPRLVRGEVLWHAIERVRDRCDVTRAEAVHHASRCRAHRRDTRRVGNAPAAGNHHALEERIDEDDDKASIRQIVAGDIRGDRFDTVGRRRTRRRQHGQFDCGKRHDLPRLAVVEHGEVRCGEAADWPAVLVEDGDVELHGVDDPVSERGGLLAGGVGGCLTPVATTTIGIPSGPRAAQP